MLTTGELDVKEYENFVECLLPFSLECITFYFDKNIKTELYITVILPVVLYGGLSHIKGRGWIDSVRERGTEENICS
jgi:hypothetical protein